MGKYIGFQLIPRQLIKKVFINQGVEDQVGVVGRGKGKSSWLTEANPDFTSEGRFYGRGQCERTGKYQDGEPVLIPPHAPSPYFPDSWHGHHQKAPQWPSLACQDARTAIPPGGAASPLFFRDRPRIRVLFPTIHHE